MKAIVKKSGMTTVGIIEAGIRRMFLALRRLSTPTSGVILTLPRRQGAGDPPAETSVTSPP